MDRLVKALCVAAGVVVIASGTHYLWSAYQADRLMKCRGDIVVREALKCIASGACKEFDYMESMTLCLKRGYPL